MYNIKCSLNDDLRPQKGGKSSSSFLSLSIGVWLVLGFFIFFKEKSSSLFPPEVQSESRSFSCDNFASVPMMAPE